MIEQALLLAGGLGTRLRELTQTSPKPMLSIGGRPFLEVIIANLRRHGIVRIVLSVGYLSEIIEQHFGSGSSHGVEIVYSRERTPLGTGGGLRRAASLLEEEFLVLNGDSLFDFNYLDLALLRRETGASAALALTSVDDASRYGSVILEGAWVRKFGEKARRGPGLISGGVYVMTRQTLKFLPEGPSSIETALFPALVEHGLLAARSFSGLFIDIGTPETLTMAETLIPQWQDRPCAILGRDVFLRSNQ